MGWMMRVSRAFFAFVSWHCREPKCVHRPMRWCQNQLIFIGFPSMIHLANLWRKVFNYFRKVRGARNEKRKFIRISREATISRRLNHSWLSLLISTRDRYRSESDTIWNDIKRSLIISWVNFNNKLTLIIHDVYASNWVYFVNHFFEFRDRFAGGNFY